MIGDLFVVETTIRGQASAERNAHVPSGLLAPILDAFIAHLKTELAQIGGKSPLAKAIHYATSQWAALTRFVADGSLEPSNYAAEWAIRPVILGRRSYFFAGFNEGGRRAAIFYTLFSTARLNGLDPRAWLTDVIGRIADHPTSQLDGLFAWASTRSQRPSSGRVA